MTAPDEIWIAVPYERSTLRTYTSNEFRQVEYRRADLPPTPAAALALPQIAAFVRSVDDVVCGRGMFGIDPQVDLVWATDHLTAALAALTPTAQKEGK